MPTSPRLALDAAVEGSLGSLKRWLCPVLMALAAIAAMLPRDARAEDGVLTWIVKSISSDEDGDFIPASALHVPQVGEALAAGQQISTAAGQRMVLVNGRDLMEIRPNTTLTLGDNDPATPDPNADLLTGTIHVEVGKRTPGQTFSIGAPYLVATVKGTAFDVSASRDASAVSVTEGIVAVRSALSGASIDVAAGNTAIVARHTLGAPTLVPTPASGAPSSIGPDGDLENAGADGGSSGSNAGGSGSGSSTSGGSGLGGAVGGATGAVGDAVGGTAEGVGGAVSGATGALGDAVGGDVGGAVSGVGGAVGDTVGSVGKNAGDAVNGVGGAAGGLLGGGNH
jgi:hypothetical protein